MVCTLLVGGPAFALDPALRLTQYQHTSWKSGDGVPRGIAHIAQTPDGFLWLATEEGLFRFDGRNFDSVARLGAVRYPRTVTAPIAVDPKGVLWFAAADGIYRYDGSRLEPVPDTKQIGNVIQILIGASGRAWVVADQKLSLIENGTVRRVSEEDGLTAGPIADIRLDALGQLLVLPRDAKAESFWILRSGQARWETVLNPSCSNPTQASDGLLWCAGQDGLGYSDQSRPASPMKRISQEAHGEMFFDRDRALWVQTKDGLRHIGHPGAGTTEADLVLASENMRETDGLTSSIVKTIFEARDGTVWVATTRGLDRFREGRFTPVLTQEKFRGGTLVPGVEGAVYAAGWSNKVELIPASGPSIGIDAGPGIQAMTAGPHRDVWTAGVDLEHVVEGQPTPVELPEWLKGSIVVGLVVDEENQLWATTSLKDLAAVRKSDGVWIRPTITQGIADHWSPTAPTRASRGGVLFGDIGGVWRWDGKLASRKDLTAEKLGSILSLEEHADRLWIGCVSGLVVLVNDRIIRIRDRDQRRVLGVLQTIELDNGDLWISSTYGLKRIRAEEVRQAIATTDGTASIETFDERDGMSGVPLRGWGTTPMAKSTDGRLWFATDSGLFRTDPGKERGPVAPPVPFFRKLLVDGSVRDLSKAEIEPNPEQVEIDFASVSPQDADRLRFRYRIEGLNTNWQDVGPRPAAYYSGLPAGRHQLLVQAAVANGPWSESGVLAFQVRPAWYQTIAFKLAMFAFAIAVAYALYRLRVRQLTGRVRALMEVRQGERDRIAQDLHDTLLQTIYAALLRFDVLSKKLARDDIVRIGLENEMERLETVVDETRGQVTDMRSSETNFARWIADVKAHGEAMCSISEMAFSITVVGEPGLPDSAHAHDLRAIVREAITNASRHSNGSRVDVVVQGDAKGIDVSIDDDGDGVGDAGNPLGKPGHWGLVGMRERAARLGAKLSITTGEGGGTRVEIELPMPANKATKVKDAILGQKQR